MHSTVLSHTSLESSISFHLANLLSSASMINTQIQALILEYTKADATFSDSIRKDILAVVNRDPAVKAYTDVLLYFKGFHALQSHRVAHWLWKNGRSSLG
jgi:serine O-acetyltransferase